MVLALEMLVIMLSKDDVKGSRLLATSVFFFGTGMLGIPTTR